jgi:hypothetical protein
MDSTPGGNFPIVVTGTGGGLTHTAYVMLAVPGFTISAPPNAFLNQSGSTTSTIIINDINGFDSNVRLTVSGLPKGVTAYFTPPVTATTSKLLFEATPLAETGFASVTITGTSGKITPQTATITLAVSAAIGRFGFGMQANLSSAFNINGIYVDTSAALSALQQGQYQNALVSGGTEATCPSECLWQSLAGHGFYSSLKSKE